MLFSISAIILASLFSFLFLVRQYVDIKFEVSHRLQSGNVRRFVLTLLFFNYLSVFVFIVYHLSKLVTI